MLRLLIIFGVLGLFFYSIIRYGRFKYSVHNNLPSILSNKDDLSKLNIKQVYDELIYYVNSPDPITHWGKERRQQKIYYYIDKINSLKALGLDIENFNADILTHEDRLNNLIAQEKHGFDMSFLDRIGDYQFTEYQSELDEKEFEKRKRDYDFMEQNKKIDIEERYVDISKKKADIDKIYSDSFINNLKETSYSNMINAKSEKEKALSDFINKTLSLINLNAFDSRLQAYIMASIFNPGGDQFSDFGMLDEIKDAAIKMKQAEADLQKANAKKANAAADQETYKAKTIKEKYKRDKMRRSSNE